MDRPNRIYLDNAATSWPKPPGVYAAVERAMRELGAPAGRSAYHEAAEVESLVRVARLATARLIGAENPENIIFTANGTDSLNLAIHGVLSAGDHVITTVAEHNSVLRPLRHLEQQGVINLTYVPCNAHGLIDAEDIRAAVRPATRMIAMIHASNVTGALQPAAEVGRIARERELIYLLDAAQSLGHLPISVEALGVDLLAAPGHKGLLGPLGTGMLYIRPGVEQHLSPIRQGGTGTDSSIDRQPMTLPDRYEAGNLNVPGILGLGAGIEYLADRTVEEIRRHDEQLTHRLLDALEAVEGVTLFGPPAGADRVGVVSLKIDGYDPQEAAAMLDVSCGVQVRPGLHCAPRMHEALGTTAAGGTLRISLGAFTTEADIDAAVLGVAKLTAPGMNV